MHTIKNLLCTTALCVMTAPAASAAVINVIYSGYGHNGQALLTGPPATLSPAFDTGNMDSSGSFMTTHSANVTTPDSLATGTRTLTLNDTGSGTGTFSSSNLTSQATINDPSYTANKQFDGGNYRYVGFMVDEPGVYTFEFLLNTRNRVSAPGGAGQYAYYGLGGSGSVEINNFPAANTPLYNTGSTGNIGDPAPNTTVASFTTTLSLSAGVQYQLNYNSYMYSGFGGTGTIEHNSGWNVNVIAPVPEPSTGTLSLALIGAATLRRRRCPVN